MFWCGVFLAPTVQPAKACRLEKGNNLAAKETKPRLTIGRTLGVCKAKRPMNGEMRVDARVESWYLGGIGFQDTCPTCTSQPPNQILEIFGTLFTGCPDSLDRDLTGPETATLH